MRRIFAIALLLSVCSCSHGLRGVGGESVKPHANEVGNGGDVVVCRTGSGNVESERLLDYYESPDVDFGDAPKSPMDKVALILQRLSRVDAKRASEYTEKAKEFFDNTFMAHGKLLTETLDFGYIKIPSNCEIEQLAIQKEPTGPDTRLYTINADLWEPLSSENKAGLMLHEIIYGDALRRGHKTSGNTRKFNGLISSSSFPQMSQAAYDEECARLSLSDTSKLHPPRWTRNPIIFQACANADMSFDLGAYATDPDGAALSLSAPNRPNWLYMSELGHLIGHPTIRDIGRHEFPVTATKADALSDTSLFKLEVTNCQAGESPFPSPIRMAAGELMSTDLSARFRLVGKYALNSGPKFLTVSGSGMMLGEPTASDLGEFLVEIGITDGKGNKITRKETVIVYSISWKSDPIDLGVQVEGKAFQFDFSGFVVDKLGLPLHFKCDSTGWLSLTGSQLSGTPARSNVGPYEFTCSASDGYTTVPVGLRGAVMKATENPGWRQDTVLLDDAYEDRNFAFDLSPYVSNPQGVALTYSIVGGPSWLSMSSATGMLFGTPTKKDIGNSTGVLKIFATVEGQQVEASTNFQISVLAVPHPPHWIRNPIAVEAKVGETFVLSLRSLVEDPEQRDSLSFALVEGSAKWLSVSADGTARGIPQKNDLGQDSFVVRVSNADGLYDDATLNINVKGE